MRTAKQVAAEVAKLLAEARRIGRKRLKIIQGIVRQMQANDITLKEIGDALGAKRTKKTTKRKRVSVKYRDKAGNTWTGRGSAPRWLVAAEKAGKKREQFAV
jgi:DNA-binding protein H-NS